MIKIFRRGGRGGDTFETPHPTNHFCLYPPPVLRCVWKDPLMTPPPHFKHLSLLPPTPSTTPSPLKILIIHQALLTALYVQSLSCPSSVSIFMVYKCLPWVRAFELTRAKTEESSLWGLVHQIQFCQSLTWPHNKSTCHFGVFPPTCSSEDLSIFPLPVCFIDKIG